MRIFPNPRRKRAGFSLLELMAVVAVVGILGGTLLNRILIYQEQAEKAAMEQTLSAIRSALNMQFASLVAKGRMSEVPGLAEQNPMNWLAEKPGNYKGEFYTVQPEDVVPGYWYFDSRQKNLLYFPRSHAYLRTEKNEGSQIRYGVKLITNNNDVAVKNDSLIEGIVLEQVVPYTWF